MSNIGTMHMTARNSAGRCVRAAPTSKPEFEPPKIASRCESLRPVSMSHSADEVEIRVEDSGPGITAEQQDRLFEAFYTTKSKGTGLGLAVTKTLLEKMGASIAVSNRNGVGNGTAAGAIFRISLRAPEIS